MQKTATTILIAMAAAICACAPKPVPNLPTPIPNPPQTTPTVTPPVKTVMPAPVVCPAGNPNRCDISRVMNMNKGKMQIIYMQALKDNPNLGGGNIKVHFKISPEGHVGTIFIVSSTFHNPVLEAQFVAQIKDFTFAAGDYPEYEGDYIYHFCC